MVRAQVPLSEMKVWLYSKKERCVCEGERRLRLCIVQYKLSADAALRRAKVIAATYCNGIARDGRGPEQLDNEAAADLLTVPNANVSHY